VPEILDRNLSRAGDVCLLLSFALTAMMAADQEDDREEEKDAAPHSFFCERISAETGTGGQRRQRRHRRELGALSRWRVLGEHFQTPLRGMQF